MKRILISAFVLVFASSMAVAVDNAATAEKPDLKDARAAIAKKDYPAAIASLTPLLGKYQDPDVYNLLGFSYRKSGDLKQATTFYAKALDADPNFKPTLEYQGEMWLEQGNLAKAQENLAKLVILCPNGCEERADLEKAISAAK